MQPQKRHMVKTSAVAAIIAVCLMAATALVFTI